MFLIRVIIIVALVMAMIPVINKAISYFNDKSSKVKEIGDSAKEIWNK